MVAIRKVLIAIDDHGDEENALATGLTLASQQGASVLVFGVSQDADRWSASLSDLVAQDELMQRVVDHKRSQLDALAQRQDIEGLDIRIEVVSGSPFVEIIRKALAESADIIVQSSHPEETGRLFFTSADWHLMRKSPVPVWIVKDRDQREPKHIAVAVDVLSTEPDAESFNQHLLDFAATIAQGSKARLSVLSAWKLEGEATIRNSPFLNVSAESLDLELKGKEAQARAAQDELRRCLELQESGLPKEISWHLEKATALEAIPRFVRRENVDLMVMGTVGRTGIPGLLIGNTAETVLSELECSVITLKPSPFVTPVVC